MAILESNFSFFASPRWSGVITQTGLDAFEGFSSQPPENSGRLDLADTALCISHVLPKFPFVCIKSYAHRLRTCTRTVAPGGNSFQLSFFYLGCPRGLSRSEQSERPPRYFIVSSHVSSGLSELSYHAAGGSRCRVLWSNAPSELLFCGLRLASVPG